MKVYNKEIGKRLKMCRKAKSLTQEQLSERIGLATNSYSNIENGSRLFSIDILIKLVKELDVSADYILTGTTSNNDPILNMIKTLNSKDIIRLEKIIKLFIESINDRG